MLNRRNRTELANAIHSQEQVAGLTHGFYRYPARFSPLFVRAAIKAFTKTGDIVFDPFVGGGTTAVEAISLGRRAIGVDASSLAVFITRVKTTLLSKRELDQVRSWARDLVQDLSLRNPPVRATEWIELGYQRNIDTRNTWPIRKTLELTLDRVHDLPTDPLRSFARCALLKTAQWALDCRTEIPAAGQFRSKLLLDLDEMAMGMTELVSRVTQFENNCKQPIHDSAVCLQRSAVGIETEPRLGMNEPPALIITSPPYPGVHILYHRWQVRGRTETPAPFWIAGVMDGNGASFYTFGDRQEPGLDNYFDRAYSALQSVARISGDKTLVIQMVAFSEPKWQLPRYLRTAREAGLREVKFPELSNSHDGRIWRSIPNRKWYANKRETLASGKEVVLFHRVA